MRQIHGAIVATTKQNQSVSTIDVVLINIHDVYDTACGIATTTASCIGRIIMNLPFFPHADTTEQTRNKHSRATDAEVT